MNFIELLNQGEHHYLCNLMHIYACCTLRLKCNLSLNAPATTGAFYFFNQHHKPLNQPLIPGTDQYLAPQRAGFFISNNYDCISIKKNKGSKRYKLSPTAMQSNPFAITIDGEQYPSISKILQSDPKRKTYYKSVGARRKQAFKDGDAAATGRHRGDSLHEAFAQYITTGECDVSPVYMEFWNHLYQFITPFNIKPVWAEAPLLPEHQHFTNGETSCIWSKKGKWLGKPDLIANFEGVNTVIEIKTSNHPYSKSFDRRQFLKYGEFYSYAYASMQTAAYSQCWKECTGETIDAGIVINVMRDGLQMFVVEYPEMQLRLKNFRKLAKDYHAAH